MIDYETYKKKFGTRSKKIRDRHVSISQDIYEMLGKDARFGVAFDNETNLALMEDVLIAISTAMMNDDHEKLKSWKKFGMLIKKVLLKFKADENCLNADYYRIAASPEERDLFVSNPIEKDNITLKVCNVLTEYGMFYRAMSTDVGEAVLSALIHEKKDAVETLYQAKEKNGSSSYYSILTFVLSNWSRRISMYESYSRSLKLINGGFKKDGK